MSFRETAVRNTLSLGPALRQVFRFERFFKKPRQPVMERRSNFLERMTCQLEGSFSAITWIKPSPGQIKDYHVPSHSSSSLLPAYAPLVARPFRSLFSLNFWTRAAGSSCFASEVAKRLGQLFQFRGKRGLQSYLWDGSFTSLLSLFQLSKEVLIATSL